MSLVLGIVVGEKSTRPFLFQSKFQFWTWPRTFYKVFTISFSPGYLAKLFLIQLEKLFRRSRALGGRRPQSELEMMHMSKKILFPISVALVIALFAGLWMTGDALAQGGRDRFHRLRAARRGLGEVTAVGSAQFTIEKLDGEAYTFLVNEETRFTDKERNELSFEDVLVDHWLIAIGPLSEDGERIARLVVILPEDFDPTRFAGAVGTILSVDLSEQEFSLESRQGEEFTFEVDENTRFFGGAQELSDLEEGTGAGVRALKVEDGGLLAKVVRTRRPNVRLAGEVTAVDESAGTLTIQTRRVGREITIQVDENTQFRSRDGDIEDLGDLEPGMVAVVVANRAEDGELPLALVVGAEEVDQLPDFEKRIGGRVLSVGTNELTIRARDGEEYTIQVTGSTNFRSRGGQVAGLEDLEEGMGVIVGGNELGNGRIQAQLVIVLVRGRPPLMGDF